MTDIADAGSVNSGKKIPLPEIYLVIKLKIKNSKLYTNCLFLDDIP